MHRLRLALRVRRMFAVGVASALALGMLGVATGAAAAAPTDLLLSEYVEGSSNNKAIEIFNGTGTAIDLTANGYRLEIYFNGSLTPGLNVSLTGTVADGDVFVFASASAASAILAQADLTTAAGLFNGDDAVVLRRGGAGGPVVDSIGQVGFDPGTEWGGGLTSTADNTLRRLATVTAGDTNPTDAFDPSASWVGFATDTFDDLGAHALNDGAPTDLPAALICGQTLVTPTGTAATRVVSATDPDGAITDLDVSSVVPVPAAGSISRTAFSASPGVGETATAEITASAGVPPGSYEVTVTSSDADATTASCAFSIQVTTVLTVGEVQGRTTDAETGRTDRSQLAPSSGNGSSSQLYDVRGVITQKTLGRSSSGVEQNGFFLQSRDGLADGDPLTSDGIFVFLGRFTSLVNGYVPEVGDEVIVRARVSEFFNLTQLTSASLVSVLASGLDVATAVEISDATPPADLADADRFWERHEGMRMRVRAGSATTSGRDVFASTADSEIWLVDVDSPLLERADPYARRVFRDAHPLDDVTPDLFDNGNGQRVMIGSLGIKAVAGNSTALLPPARTFDVLTSDAAGGLYFSFEKYGVQVESASFMPGIDPSANAAPAAVDRSKEFATATLNVENLYDFRDDPFDGCDFVGNAGCPGVSPPFDYVPESAEAYTARLADLASVVAGPMHSPDILLVQEAEDQDICSVSGVSLVCGNVDDADGKPDTLQELALTITAGGGPTYDAAYDRDGADDRGIVAAFLFRTDRVFLAAPGSGVLSATPAVRYRSAGLAHNADVQNPKSLNAMLPSDVDRSTGVDGSNVYTRAPQVARFIVAASPASGDTFTVWAISNHFSSTPDARVGQRREQAGYGAAIVAAIQADDPGARVVYGGDLNVFPRPDDPIAPPVGPSDQLGPLYGAGLRNLWDTLVDQVPSSAYSYVFEGQAQTLDHLFVTPTLLDDLVQVRAAHVNAGWPADFDGDRPRGVSDHDPQVARFRSHSRLSVADVSVTEGDAGVTPAVFAVTVSRPLSAPVLICAATLGITASDGQDFAGLSQCQTLPVGATSLQFTVSVRGDRRAEEEETFALFVAGAPFVRLADPVAIGTITNDD